MSDPERIRACIKAQSELARTGAWVFCPKGVCFSCGRQCFSDERWTPERASVEVLSGCSFCHRSFCD